MLHAEQKLNFEPMPAGDLVQSILQDLARLP